MSNVMIFINRDAIHVDELFLNDEWSIKEKFPRIYDIYSLNKPINWILKVYNNEEGARTEVNALNKLKHISGIPSVLVVGLSKALSYIIITKESGTDLYEYIDTNGVLSENSVRPIVKQLLYIVNKIHEHGIIHKDIKLENIIYDDNTNKLALIDFEGHQTDNFIGPEILRGNKCDELSDAWSIGITCYMLVTGDTPFNTDIEVFSNDVNYPDSWSAEFIDFLSCMLEKNPLNRWSVGDMLNHPWIGS